VSPLPAASQGQHWNGHDEVMEMHEAVSPLPAASQGQHWHGHDEVMHDEVMEMHDAVSPLPAASQGQHWHGYDEDEVMEVHDETLRCGPGWHQSRPPKSNPKSPLEPRPASCRAPRG